jgi:hypothetical protein
VSESDQGNPYLYSFDSDVPHPLHGAKGCPEIGKIFQKLGNPKGKLFIASCVPFLGQIGHLYFFIFLYLAKKPQKWPKNGVIYPNNHTTYHAVC